MRKLFYCLLFLFMLFPMSVFAEGPVNDSKIYFYDYPNGYRARMDEILYFMDHNDLGITYNDRLAAIDDLNLKGLEKFGIKCFDCVL